MVRDEEGPTARACHQSLDTLDRHSTALSPVSSQRFSRAFPMPSRVRVRHFARGHRHLGFVRCAVVPRPMLCACWGVVTAQRSNVQGDTPRHTHLRTCNAAHNCQRRTVEPCDLTWPQKI
ncbi:uncharacterized protein B0H18DRAFT_991079 [Fomitopsis serialis]|uniref:uncharacterized protein n=1 Tax=Fomitopsis serialis TaxID=139415 RepID=UPI0020084AF8|nr:uncharacterized protein B0H18DRAFT_991079 [Neoantrodia serialis]KAH9931308.1 hypothetical protein B0H18DRAFT_991079 [Neoantrodia serialis]